MKLLTFMVLLSFGWVLGVPCITSPGKNSLKPFLRGGYKDILLLLLSDMMRRDCFGGLKFKEFLEMFGIKLEPIAGESACEMGKHSKHLQP
jgi:hypothetical protein